MFHLKCGHFILVRFWLLSCHLLEKKTLLTRLIICSICICLIVILVISDFCFEGWIWVLVTSVPGLCILLLWLKLHPICLT